MFLILIVKSFVTKCMFLILIIKMVLRYVNIIIIIILLWCYSLINVGFFFEVILLYVFFGIVFLLRLRRKVYIFWFKAYRFFFSMY